MPSADGTPCPMHRPAEPREHHQSSTNECALRGTCEGPMAALFALLSNHGILPESVAAIPSIGVGSSSRPARENIVSRRDSPDPHRRAHKRHCSGSKAVVCLLGEACRRAWRSL